MVPITVQSVTIEKLRRFTLFPSVRIAKLGKKHFVFKLWKKLRETFTLFPSVAHCKARQIKKHFAFIDSMVPITVQSVTIEKLRRFTLFPSERIAK